MTDKLAFSAFARTMVQTGDLDPVYIAVVKARMEREQLARWLLTYGLFYHVGVASWMSEKEDGEFWNHIHLAAENETHSPAGGRWPRASERRHFRGQFSVDCVERLAKRYPQPEEFMLYISGAAPHVHEVRNRVEEHKGFGGWASFKFADLTDRVWGVPVEFDLKTAMYDTPTKGALLVHELEWNEEPGSLEDAVRTSQELFELGTRGLLAPPLEDRSLGFAELETALCKFKSYRKGSYHIGKDIIECREAAAMFADQCGTAESIHEEFDILAHKMEKYL